MPRAARIDKPCALQHVIVKGVETRNIFEDDADRASFLQRLDLLLQETRMSCFAWSLLPDHFHLLLQPSSQSLSHFMRRLLTGYAMAFNHRHGRRGRLFQKRYRSVVCDEEDYLLELVRYVHLNPLRAGLIDNVKALDRYPWSGHSVLLGFKVLEGQSAANLLSHFGRKIENCRKRYRRFVRAGANQGYRDELVGGGARRVVKSGVDVDPILSDPRILGSAEYVRFFVEEYGLRWPTGGRWQPPGSQPKVATVLPEIVRKVAEVLGISAERICQPGRSADVSYARSVISYIGYRKMGHSGEAVAAVLGITRSGVCRRAVVGEQLLRKDRRFDNSLLR